MDNFQSSTWLQWYKQSEGDTLKLIVMQPKNVAPSYGPEFASRFKATNYGTIRKLTILRVVQQDEGMYHCALIGWTESTWTGTYLKVKGNTEGILNSTIIQQAEPSHFLCVKKVGVSIFTLCTVSTLSLMVIVVLICIIIKKKSDSSEDGVELQKLCSQDTLKGHKNKWIYTAVIFTVMKLESGPINSSAQRESIYTAAKAFGL
ncbi:uncharacterized protein LOC129354966 [Poeciliopsis prolifica]|uniref:uncharacterized protein LOC129354966 n=1 Tax=Poeciliopsis prolifica TaxID=188132 RepID=UPI0024144824|nr:uncharacterized protein LOC129354966 [Poeciliopsis prolifica]